MAKTSPAEFYRQVKTEVTKVTWPSRKETTVTAIMVFIMVTIMALFFLGIDQLLAQAVRWILGLGA